MHSYVEDVSVSGSCVLSYSLVSDRIKQKGRRKPKRHGAAGIDNRHGAHASRTR
jgi:hypothetical protein